MIDDNPDRFTKELLRSWKTDAEMESANALGKPRHRDSRRLSRHSVTIESIDDVRKSIGNFVFDIGLPTWGEQLESITHSVLYELTLNHFTHYETGPEPVILTSSSQGLELKAPGPRFGLSDLLSSENGHGGKAAVEALRSIYRGSLLLQYIYDLDINKWTLNNTMLNGNAGPCAIDLRKMRRTDVPELAERLSNCDEIHIYIPKHFHFSDTRKFEKIAELLSGRPSIVHGLADEPGLRGYFLNIIPGVLFE